MTSCKLWKGTLNNMGYGYIYWDGKDAVASRVIWEIVNGPIPPGMWVLHTCDNPACVNPTHLYLGDALNNAQDRDTRKRSNIWFGLSDAQKAQIQELKGKMSQEKIAKLVGCSQTTVARWSR